MKQDSTYFKQSVAEEYFKQKQEADKIAKEEKLYGPNRDAGIKFLRENALKDSVITIKSVLVEGTIETNGIGVSTAALKNDFGLQTGVGRDDYVNDVVDKITRIVNG